MLKLVTGTVLRLALGSALAASSLLTGCGVADTRDQVVYPNSRPIPRDASYRVPSQPAAEQRSTRSGCPNDAEELAPGSICPASARCFESGGKRCISYEH